MKAPGLQDPLATAALFHPDKNVLTAVAAIAATYVLAVELLISYWIYQLFHIFRIGRYVMKMENRLRDYLGCPEHVVLFGWGTHSKGLEDARTEPEETLSLPVKFALAIGSLLQPLSLYAMAALGLLGFVLAIVANVNLNAKPPLSVSLGLSVLWLVLLTGLVTLVFVHLALHKWIIGESYLPFHGVFKKPKRDNDIEEASQQSDSGDSG